MKATELRLGNYVYHESSTCKLETVLAFEDVEEYNPIPLTEEWLLKFGCGKKEINDYYKETDDFGILFYHEINFNGGWFTLGINSDNEYYLCDSGYDLDDKDSMASFACGLPSIKYVHQLQNLYFALTGEELEIRNT